MKKGWKIVIGLVAVTFILYGIQKWRDHQWFMKNNAYLEFNGRVLDQYGHPIPGAQVTAAFPYPRGGNKGYSTEYDRATTDDNGYLKFSSKPRRHSMAEIHINDGFDKNGGFYRGEHTTLTFEYNPEKGWNTGSPFYYDPVKGWQKHQHSEKLVTLRAGRSSGLISTTGSELELKGDASSASACYNLNDGELHPVDFPKCDLKFEATPCPGGKGDLLKLTAPEGGVLWHDEHKMSEIEAPPEGYERTSYYAEPGCPADYHPEARRVGVSDSPLYYFAARNFTYFGKTDYNGRHEGSPRSVWARLTIIYNPHSGDRSLLGCFGNQECFDGAKMPIEFPYKDPWHLDYSKITVIEDKEMKEIRVVGKPGAVRDAELIWIMNLPTGHGEQAEVIERHPNPNGSFDLRIKADLYGAKNLKIKYLTNREFTHWSFVYVPLTKIIKINNDARNKASASAK
jgi:hypothetical protein